MIIRLEKLRFVVIPKKVGPALKHSANVSYRVRFAILQFPKLMTGEEEIPSIAVKKHAGF